MRAVLLLLAAALVMTVAPVGHASGGPLFSGSVHVDAAFGFQPAGRRIVARPEGRRAVNCGSTIVSARGRYELILRPADRACEGEIWFYILAQGERRLAESAFSRGAAQRTLNLHLWAPMRVFGDVRTTQDVAAAGMVACVPNCLSRERAFCGGGPIFDYRYAFAVAPMNPDRRCARPGGTFQLGVLTAEGGLFPAAGVHTFRSGEGARLHPVAGFRRGNTSPVRLLGLPRAVDRGRKMRLVLLVNLRTAQPGLSWWVDVGGPRGAAVESVSATDPLPGSSPLHNNFVCRLHASFPRLHRDAGRRVARCTSAIGRAVPGAYRYYADVRAPRVPGTITVRMYLVAGDEHARVVRSIRVR